MKKLILLAGAVVAAGVFASGSAGSHKSDGTNVWIGAASGGSMKDLSNWKAVIDGVEHTDAASVSNLFMGHVSIDLRALADGAVVTNDINFGNIYNVRDTTGYTMVRDVIAGGEGGGNFTITQNGGKGMFLCQPSTINVEGGTLFWNDSASGYYPYKQ